VLAEVRKVVVGQDDAFDLLLAAASVSGHALLEGAPGTAKTLAANALARALGVSFGRVQFTPDMLPSDLTGTMILRMDGAGGGGGSGGSAVNSALHFRPGPIFTQVLLADEINRTPPKTQAALLEAMQEAQVTVDGHSHELPEPFFVIATQNPIEYEGTYPLPEAQLDRFLVKIDVPYPGEADEQAILLLTHRGVRPSTLDDVRAVADVNALREVRELVDATTVTIEVIGYIAAVVRKTRELPSVALGASPRAGVHLLAASRAAARLAGRDFVTPDDVAAMAPPVLRHRLLLRPEAELERYRPDDAIRAALAAVPVPR
jgi:MoxR-like ATPase